MDYCVFLAHYKPKENSSPKVKNMVNFSYLNLIRKWNERMSNVQTQQVNFSLSNHRWGRKRRTRLSLSKTVRGFLFIDNLLYDKICGKNIIYIMSTTHYNNFMSIGKQYEKKKITLVFRPVRNITGSSTN